MAVRITRRGMAGGSGHEHIVEVEWINEATGKVEVSDVNPTMVDFIDKHGKAFVWDGRYRIDVGTVRPQGGRPYIRTYKDGIWTDNLLALPTF
jgi:hypothetical protein